MKLELFIIIISGAILYDMYHGSMYSKKIMEFKKYFRMGIFGLGAFSLYLLFKRQPNSMYKLLISLNDVVKGLPLSKIISTTDGVKISTNTNTNNINNINYDSKMVNNNISQLPPQNHQHKSSNFSNHSKSTKRSVSETKKKFVASSQDWKCGNCGRMLNAWFEVDHRIRLEHGGSNDASNLVAMCRECHGEKTALENM